MTDRRAFISSFALAPVALAEGQTVRQAGSEKAGAAFRQYMSIKEGPFNAAGDGVTDDTAAWEAFQAAPGLKFIPAGRYLTKGKIKRFDKGVFGNGVFLDESKFTWVHGDNMRDSFLVHSRTINANATIISPVIKTQTKVSYNVSTQGNNNLFVRVVGPYHEVIGAGEIVGGMEGSVGNFTTLGAVADNRFAGLFGMTAITGRVFDAKESEIPEIRTLGASKSLSGYFPFMRRSKYASGGYMLGLETYCFNNADETEDIPYTNNDAHAFTSFTVGYHCTAAGAGAPITDGILIDGLSSAKHGLWNGIVIGASAMKINNITAGAVGTVGINLSSWNTAYGDIGIKFRNANRHLHFVNGAKIQSSTTRLINSAGAAALTVEGASGTQRILLRGGASTDPDPTPVEYASLAATSTAAALTARGNDIQIRPGDGAAVYVADTARFAPSGALDGTLHLGGGAQRFNTIYATTGTINTSDEREKADIATIPDTVLDAWGEVGWEVYRFRDAVALKGDAARMHSGLIAQRVVEAFERHGLNARDWGLLCYDEWQAQKEATQTEKIEMLPAVYKTISVMRHGKNLDGSDFSYQEEVESDEILIPAVYGDRVTAYSPAIAAGNRYGIRYEEALCFEAAYQRRRADRIEARLAALEAAT